MGRGSYLGGSTIITAWGSGWSPDARSPIQKKSKTAASKPPTFEKQFRNYAHSCGTWSSKNKPWQAAPKLVKAHFEGDLDAIKNAVLESDVYKQKLAGKKKKTNKSRPQASAKKELKERDRAERLLRIHAKECAESDQKQMERPAVPKCITEKYSEDDVKLWLSEVHHTAPYKAESRKLNAGMALRSARKSKKR